MKAETNGKHEKRPERGEKKNREGRERCWAILVVIKGSNGAGEHQIL